MNLDRTEPRPIQKQRRPTDRSGPWMTIGPDRTDAHINLGRDMRCRSVFGPSLHLDRTDRSKQLRWTEPIGPGDTDGPDRTNSIGSIRLGLKSVGPGRYRSGPDRGCPYLPLPAFCSLSTTSLQ